MDVIFTLLVSFLWDIFVIEWQKIEAVMQHLVQFLERYSDF